MKGLILKDIYGCRFQIIGGLAIMFFPMILSALMGGEMSVSDRENGIQTLGVVSVVLYGMMNYMSIVVCSSFYLNTLAFDEASGWTKMQRAMPLSGGEILGGKFLCAWAIVGSLTMVSLVFNFVSAVIFEIPKEPMLTMPLVIGLMELITLLPTIVLGYRFGAKTINWFYFVVLIAVAAGSIVLIAAFLMGDIPAKVLRMVAYIGVPALTAVVTTVCFFTGRKAVMLDI